MSSRNTLRPRFNPWQRVQRQSLPWNVHYERRDHFGRFDENIKENMGLDCITKSAALKASAYVVSLKSYSGTRRLFICSGIIVNSDGVDGDFCSTILTSATLMRCPNSEAAIADDIKVNVYLVDGSLCEGEILGYDFHYNVAAISIKTSICLQIAIIGNVEDFTEAAACSHGSSSFEVVPYRDRNIKLCPGMAVIALGRYHAQPYHIMAAPGALSLEYCGLDCAELLMSDCEITKNGIGGPLIDYSGCVIGMSFYKSPFTPVLPINIALKCLEHLLKYRAVPRPWLGIKLSDLDTAGLGELEKLSQSLSNPFEGVVVRKVESESPAAHAGLCTGDIIVQLDGEPISRSLKFESTLLDKINVPLTVMVRRAGSIAPLTLTLLPQNLENLNRWPIPKKWSILKPDT